MTDQSKRTPREFEVILDSRPEPYGDYIAYDFNADDRQRDGIHVREVTGEPTFTLAEVLPLVEALKKSQHEIITVQDLTATDKPGSYNKALANGCDASGAYDTLMENSWDIDSSKVLSDVEKALAQFQKLLDSKK